MTVAAVKAKAIVAEFPADTCKLLSITVEGYVEPPAPGKPHNAPPDGTLGGGLGKVPTVQQMEAYMRGMPG